MSAVWLYLRFKEIAPSIVGGYSEVKKWWLLPTGFNVKSGKNCNLHLEKENHHATIVSRKPTAGQQENGAWFKKGCFGVTVSVERASIVK